MSLVQSPTIPGAMIARVAAVAALLGASVLAWFAVVKPTIEDAAADQVDRRLDELAPAATSSGDDDPAVAVTTTVVAGGDTVDDPRVPTFVRLEVAAPLTQTADDSVSIPDGGTFDLTDLRIENTYDDRGVATLLVNTEPIFIWSLENIRGQYFEPRITPIRLDPGDNVTFSVRCDQIGDASRSTCTAAVNMVGLTERPSS